MINKLSEPAQREQQQLYKNFAIIYNSSRYIIAILFSRVVTACFSMITQSDTKDLRYKGLGFVVAALCVIITDQIVKKYANTYINYLRLASMYMAQMFMSAVLGNLQSLAYEVGTIEYLYLTVAMLVGVLTIAVVLALAYLRIGEDKIIELENEVNFMNHRYKHRAFVKQQILSSVERPI